MNIYKKMATATNLTTNEVILTRYIEQNPNTFVNKSAAEVAEACFVSVSTIYRLCQKLGLSGISALKVEVSKSLHMPNQEQVDFDYPFSADDNEHQPISASMAQLYNQTIADSEGLVDEATLQIVADAVQNANTIDFYTTAGNIYFAENFKFQMQELGITINVPLEGYLQTLTAATSNGQHLAIIVSYEGRGAIIPDIARILSENKTPLLLITSTHKNILTQYANYTLFLSSNENHFHKMSSFSTRLSLLYILDCIYTTYFKLDYAQHQHFKLASYKKMTGIG